MAPDIQPVHDAYVIAEGKRRERCGLCHQIRTHHDSNAGETLGDGLLVAMALKVLPESYGPPPIHFELTDDNITFGDFKKRLRCFKALVKIRAAESSNSWWRNDTKMTQR